MKQQITFMRLACLQCDRASCGYKTGAVAARGGKIIASAFNKTLKGEKYCQGGRCHREKHGLTGGREIEKVCSIHAEVNLIATAARKGSKLEGADLYLSTFPCYICSKAVVQAGFKRLFYMSDYGGNEGWDLLAANGIKIVRITEDKVWGKKRKVQSDGRHSGEDAIRRTTPESVPKHRFWMRANGHRLLPE